MNYVHHLLIFLFRGIACVPARLMYFGAKIVALFLLRTKNDLRQTTQINLQIAYPDLADRQLHQLLKHTLHHSVYGLYEILRVWTNTFEQTKKQFISCDGVEILNELIAAKKPIIILSPHLGCWEIVGYWLNSLGHQMSILYKPSNSDVLNDFMVTSRNKSGNEIVPVNQSGINRILHRLRHNEIVGILPDQVPSNKSGRIMAPFFCTDAGTMTLVHSLIKKTNATPILVTAIRETYKGFHVHVHACEDIICTDPKQSVTAMNRNIEKLIALAPEQYQWSYRRYRYNPLVKYN